MGAVWARSEGSALASQTQQTHMEHMRARCALDQRGAPCLRACGPQERSRTRNSCCPAPPPWRHGRSSALGRNSRACRPTVVSSGGPFGGPLRHTWALYCERAGPRETGCSAPQSTSWPSDSTSSGLLPSGRSSASELRTPAGRRGHGMRRGCLQRLRRVDGRPGNWEVVGSCGWSGAERRPTSGGSGTEVEPSQKLTEVECAKVEVDRIGPEEATQRTLPPAVG